MKIKIRQVNMGDLDAVTKVEEICFPSEEAASLESLKKRIETFPESFFVAETAPGAIIGFVNGCVLSLIYSTL